MKNKTLVAMMFLSVAAACGGGMPGMENTGGGNGGSGGSGSGGSGGSGGNFNGSCCINDAYYRCGNSRGSKCSLSSQCTSNNCTNGTCR